MTTPTPTQTQPRQSKGAWRTLRALPGFWLGLVLLVLMLLVFGLGAMLLPSSFDEIVGLSKAPASWQHPLGLDEIGRDRFARLAMAGRYSLVIGLSVSFLTTLIGLVIGLVAGWYGGVVDLALSQVTNLLIVVPSFIVLLVAGIRWGADIRTMPILLSVLLWPAIARIVRAMTLQIKGRGYVRASIVAGASTFRIMRKDILPNLSGAMLVNATLVVATAIILESTLSFLGVGVKPPTPTLGTLVANSRAAVSSDPTPLIAPSLSIVLIVITFNMLGESLQRLVPGSQQVRP